MRLGWPTAQSTDRSSSAGPGEEPPTATFQFFFGIRRVQDEFFFFFFFFFWQEIVEFRGAVDKLARSL